MEKNMYYIGIDLGGTNIAAGIVDENGTIVCQTSTPTLKERPIEEIMDDMAMLCFKLCDESGISMEEIEAVGIGCPGSVDNKNGIISYSNNIPMKMVEMSRYMEAKLGKKINLENDANAAAFGEYVINGGGAQSFLFITLGTGVGGGVILDGKIFRGFNGVASEAGHMTLVHDGELCTCGKAGCWEAYASVTALIRQTKRAIEENPDSKMCECGTVTGRTAFDAAKAGDAAAQKVVEKYCRYVADGIVSLVNILEPEKVCIGGGISREGDYLLNPIKEFVDKYEYNKYCPKTVIETATLFNEAGIIGAALAAK